MNPLPIFEFHEASFLGISLMGVLDGLAEGPLPNEEASPQDNVKMLRYIEQGLQTFLSTIDKVDALPRLNKQKLKEKLLHLNESQKVKLYQAVKRLFWIDDQNLSLAEALGRAGFFGEKQEGLQVARLWERYESLRKTWEK